MDDKKMVAFAILVLFGGNFTGLLSSFDSSFRDDPFTGSQGDDLQRQINDIKTADSECRQRVSELEGVYNDHSHEAPPRWVKERLISLESGLDNAMKHVKDHNTESEMWKHRIIALEAEIQFIR